MAAEYLRIVDQEKYDSDRNNRVLPADIISKNPDNEFLMRFKLPNPIPDRYAADYLTQIPVINKSTQGNFDLNFDFLSIDRDLELEDINSMKMTPSGIIFQEKRLQIFRSIEEKGYLLDEDTEFNIAIQGLISATRK